MKIAVIGAGQAGSAIARAVAGAGHSVVVADTDADARQAAAQASGSAARSNEQAAREADLVVLAVPFSAIDEVTDEIAPAVEGVQLDGFVAGDDQAAKNTVADLLAAIGFRPVDVGGLASALALEHMAFLNISLNARNNLPFRSGWKLVGPIGNRT